MPQSSFSCFAVTAPGLEPLAAAELVALGITPGEAGKGGVAWVGGLESLYAANLHLRTASRVIVRVGSFSARTFGELERRAKRIPWDAFVAPGQAIRFRVTSHKSRLYHTGAIVQRLAAIVGPLAGGVERVGLASADDEADEPDAQLFVVRLERDEVMISADTSGALLHKRGYRQRVAKAPLRETLAAAMLLASGWDARSPLVDPMCGSGTIPIEGALLARRIPPGLGRSFACLRWPHADAALWHGLLSRARDRILERPPGLIRASDRDAGAIAATLENAERAGVAADIDVVEQALSNAEGAGSRGWVLCNPPYGVRVGDRDVRNLYAQLGHVLTTVFPNWHVGLLVRRHDASSPSATSQSASSQSAGRSVGRRVARGAAADPFIRQIRLPAGHTFATAFTTSNGGIPVRFVTGVA